MAAPARFHHHDSGTPESRWLSADGWDGRPVLDVDALVARYPRVVVAAAHPDDETLAVGGLLARLADAGAEIVVLVATSGEASHPRSTTWSADLLACTRRAEVEAALAVLAPRARIVHLGLPDGGLEGCEGELVDELVSITDASTLLLAPWIHDGHCDHDALGRASTDAVARSGAQLALYPLWVWHWSEPAEFAWNRAIIVEPGAVALARKRVALEEYGTQLYPLGPLAGDEEVVTEPVVTRSRRVVEVLLGAAGEQSLPVVSPLPATAAADPFDAMYDESDDPWATTSFYERRKHALTAGMLGRERYGRALEIGCATGSLTRLLASRCGETTGLDVSGQALAQARRLTAEAVCGSGGGTDVGGAGGGRLDGPGRIVWVHGQAPDDVPDGPFDLVVVSEVGYFMTPTQLLATLRRARRVLADGGEIVLAHWQHPTRDIPLDGPLVHAQAATFFDLPHRAHYADADVAVDVWGSPRSIARQEGLT